MRLVLSNGQISRIDKRMRLPFSSIRHCFLGLLQLAHYLLGTEFEFTRSPIYIDTQGDLRRLDSLPCVRVLDAPGYHQSPPKIARILPPSTSSSGGWAPPLSLFPLGSGDMRTLRGFILAHVLHCQQMQPILFENQHRSAPRDLVKSQMNAERLAGSFCYAKAQLCSSPGSTQATSPESLHRIC